MTNGKLLWSNIKLDPVTGSVDPPAHITVPTVIPNGGGFGEIPFNYFGVMHTPNENKYLLYIQRKIEGK
jgi:hypothetical protein